MFVAIPPEPTRPETDQRPLKRTSLASLHRIRGKHRTASGGWCFGFPILRKALLEDSIEQSRIIAQGLRRKTSRCAEHSGRKVSDSGPQLSPHPVLHNNGGKGHSGLDHHAMAAIGSVQRWLTQTSFDLNYKPDGRSYP